MFCYKCGNQLPDDAEFCNKCGAKLYKSAKKEQTASSDVHNVKTPSADTYRSDKPFVQNSAHSPIKTVQETTQFNDDQNSFINFIDSRIKANTQYNSAQELLNSQPTARFAWLSYGISAFIMLILSIIPILNGSGVLAVIFFLALSIIPGYLAAYISGGVIAKLKLLNKYTLKLKGKADKEELKRFLDNRLSYLKPYFDTWGDKTTIGFGLVGGIQAAAINATEKSSSEDHIVSYFGSNKFLMLEIGIMPGLNGDPEYTICTFSVDSRYRGFSFIASYKTMIKTAPILRAAIEYYFWWKYGEKSGVSDPPHIQPYAVGSMNYGADQNAYSSIKANCASEKRRTILNSVLISIGVIAVIAIVVFIVIMKAPSVNYIDKSTNISNTVLSNDYTSEDGSFSLKYPSDWNKIPNTAVFVELSSPDGMANIQVIECFFDAYGVFTDSEVEIKNSVNQFHTFLNLWDTKLGDVSVKALSYQTDGLKGKRTVNNYWYEVGDNLYQIICSYEKAEYKAVLDSILNSYTINNATISVSNAEYTTSQEQTAMLADKVDGSIKVDKKIRWMGCSPIDETEAPSKLFKSVYGVPELGDTSYGNDANNIFDYIHVDYADRYDQLSKMVVSGNSPDIFEFEIINYPYTAWKKLFQPIDGYIDLSDSTWDATRDAMKQFEWGGKNYCAITAVNLDQVLWYKRSVMYEAGLTDPYELYEVGNWNWNTFLEMCDKFSDPDSGKYCIDGWQVPDRIVSTTGVPFVGIENGLLKSNLFGADIERAMTTIIDTLYKENYRYPRHELNDWLPNLTNWVNGDTLFFADLSTALKDSFQPYFKRYHWGDDEVFCVPFPKDPQNNKYYNTMMIDSFMLCSGATNTAGFTAWTQCLLATQNDEETARIKREKLQNDYLGYSNELCDFLDELQFGGVMTPVFDFKGGIGQDIVDSSTVYNPVDCLAQIPYLNCRDVENNPTTFTMLRSSNEERIHSRIEEINTSVD